jgi:hypothetical protein
MTDATRDGWFVASRAAGAPAGPYAWEDVWRMAGAGQLAPHDMLWHASLPGWTRADTIAGLAFAQPAPVAAVPQRRGVRAAVVTVGALAVVVAAAVVAAMLRDIPGGEPPLVEIAVAAPTVVDVPHESASFTVTPAAGGSFSANGLGLTVPAGAVRADTALTVRRLTAPFHMTEDDPRAPATASGVARCAGPVFDLGPDGIVFDAPVTLTLPYDPAALAPGFPEEQVAVAFWNGRAWVAHSGDVDTSNHTVAVRLGRFPGLIVTTTGGVFVVGAVIVATGVHLYKRFTDPNQTVSDPITKGIANQWVTPDDKFVRAAAEVAMLARKSGPPVALDDPRALARMLEASVVGDRPLLVFPRGNADGTDRTLLGRCDVKATPWMKPGDYLDKADMSGDCTAISNTVASMLVKAGYRAKCVFGYVVDKNTPHVWVEVVIGGKPYFVDEEGRISPLNADEIARIQFVRPDKSDPRGFMWDDKKQERYDPNWWRNAPSPLDGTWDGALTVQTGSRTSTRAISLRFGGGVGVPGDASFSVDPVSPFTEIYTGSLVVDESTFRISGVGERSLPGESKSTQVHLMVTGTLTADGTIEGQVAGALKGTWTAGRTSK